MTTSDPSQIWSDLLARARATTDRARTPIDDGILETVAAFWANGFRTHASCAGHDNSWPYVHVSVLSDEDMDALDGCVDCTPPLNANARAALAAHERVLALLGEFYADRRVSVEVMLVAADLPDQYGFHVRSQGAPLVWLREGAERARLVESLQAEICAFGRFLKERVLSPPPLTAEERGFEEPLFLGRFRATVDPELRVSVPREFIAETALKRQDLSFRLFLKPGEPVALLPSRRLERFLPYLSEAEHGRSWLISVGEDGRVVLPTEAADGLGREVVFVGVDDRIELWPAHALEQHNARLGRPSQRGRPR